MSAKRKIRVLVVDDSAFVRKAVVRMLGEAEDIEVVGSAADGEEGLAKARELRPDVVTLDIKMPKLGGLETLERLMAERPVAGAAPLLADPGGGGGDAARPRARGDGLRGQVERRAHEHAQPRPGSSWRRSGPSAAHASRPGVAARRVRAAPEKGEAAEVVVIAASTGGPSGLQSLVSALPAGLRATILIVQHIPRGFTRSLAERLDARSAIPVREAADGELIEPGRVIIAPAGIHTRLRRRGARVRIVLDEEPRDALHRPSADVLMASAASVFGPRAVGVVLTGMGSDGTEGLRAIQAAGGRTLAESEETCVIYGMPKAAVAAGVVSRVVPLDRMAEEILATV